MLVNIPGIKLDHLVFNGAGSFHQDSFQWTKFAQSRNFNYLSALTLKTTLLKKKFVSKDWRELIYYNKRSKQSINCVGLQGPGCKRVCHEIQALAQEVKIPLIGSIAGASTEEFTTNLALISKTPVVAIEINLSCPNLDHEIFATSVDQTKNIVTACRKITTKPLYVKLSPNVTDITAIAKTAEQAGADALVLSNTFTGMVLTKKLKSVIKNPIGGYSHPGMFAITLANIYRVKKVCQIPIIACGGIYTAQDALMALRAGAHACQVTSGCATKKNFFQKINKRLARKLQKLKIKTIIDLHNWQ